jgi:hypothetical protein
VKFAPTDFRRFEFSFPALDTELQVELRDDEVVIRATRDAFTEDRKAAFIHELASEGFIPDEYLWYSAFEGRGSGQVVRWRIDPFWRGETAAGSHRRLVYVQALSYSALVIALFMGLLFTGSLGGFHLGAPASHQQPSAAATPPR